MLTIFNLKTNTQKFNEASDRHMEVFRRTVQNLMMLNSNISDAYNANTEMITELEVENEGLSKIKDQNENRILKIKQIYE